MPARNIFGWQKPLLPDPACGRLGLLRARRAHRCLPLARCLIALTDANVRGPEGDRPANYVGNPTKLFFAKCGAWMEPRCDFVV